MRWGCSSPFTEASVTMTLETPSSLGRSDVLQQTMFDLPSEEGVTKVVVTEASVKGEEQPQRICG